MSRGEIHTVADYALTQWRNWMFSPDHHRELGYPRASAGFSSGGINCWDDMEDTIGSTLVQAVDSIVAGLEGLEKAAIYNEYLACVWRAREGLLEESLDRALGVVGRKLIERGLA